MLKIASLRERQTAHASAPNIAHPIKLEHPLVEQKALQIIPNIFTSS
jgi:hypothetical protein